MKLPQTIGWKSKLLLDVATLQRGYDLPIQNRTTGVVPIFAANGPVGTHGEAKVKGPGVVTGRSGSIGKVHYVEADFWPLNTSLFVKDFHDNHPRFIFYLLKQFHLEKYCEGTGVPTLNRNNVHKVAVNIPPIAEQRRIAAVLDQAEALRAKRRAALAQLDSLSQAIFLERFGDPIKNPYGFPVRPMIELIDPQRPISYGILMPGPDQAEGVKYVRVTDMKNGGIDLSGIRKTTEAMSNSFRRSLLKPADLLMSIRGHVGRFAVIPPELDGANITQDSARLAIVGASSVFVRECLRTEGFQRWMAKHTKGVAVRGINLGDVKLMPIILPPRPTQEKFADQANAVEKLKTAHRASLAELDALAALQHRAFRGEL